MCYASQNRDKKPQMFNLTDRKETKFLVSIQLIKGGNQNVKKKGVFPESYYLIYLLKERDEYVPESSSSQIFVICW